MDFNSSSYGFVGEERCSAPVPSGVCPDLLTPGTRRNNSEITATEGCSAVPCDFLPKCLKPMLLPVASLVPVPAPAALQEEGRLRGGGSTRGGRREAGKWRGRRWQQMAAPGSAPGADEPGRAGPGRRGPAEPGGGGGRQPAPSAASSAKGRGLRTSPPPASAEMLPEVFW